MMAVHAARLRLIVVFLSTKSPAPETFCSTVSGGERHPFLRGLAKGVLFSRPGIQ